MTKYNKSLITSLLILFLAPAFAQTKPGANQTVTKNCYGEWYTLFRERGAKPIPDGTQEVIISLRGDNTQCFLGKVEVASGKIKLPLFVQKQDGSFETFATSGKKLDAAYVAGMSEDELLTITDGMSVSFRTSDQESGRLFFYKFLNDKPKGNKIAPPPSTLIKN